MKEKQKDSKMFNHKLYFHGKPLPFRVGRKQMRAVLDAEGHEVVIFPKANAEMATAFVEWVNSKVRIEN